MNYSNFSNLYFKRWSIEVFFNKFKNNVFGDFIDVRSSDELYKFIDLKFTIILITRLIIEISKKIFGEIANDQKIINFTSAQRIVVTCILNNMIYDNDNYCAFFCYLMKIYNNQIFSIKNRSFLHYPTKENYKNNDKEKLKIRTKENIKSNNLNKS